MNIFTEYYNQVKKYNKICVLHHELLIRLSHKYMKKRYKYTCDINTINFMKYVMMYTKKI